MQQDLRSSANNKYTIPAAPIWQDAADNEEWSAWADNTSADSAALAEEGDDFGAWVDSSDPADSFHFQTPMSSSYVSTDHPEEPNVVTVRQLRRMNGSEQDASLLAAATTQTLTVSQDPTVGLYKNPWNDSNPTADRVRPQDQLDYSDDGDVDPEIDSALASSAWESVLVQDRSSAHGSDTNDDRDDDDDDGTYEAWNVGAQIGSDEAIEERTCEPEARSTYEHNESGRLHHRPVPSEGGLEWYNTDFSEIKETQRRPPTWMQRLTGSRGRREENSL